MAQFVDFSRAAAKAGIAGSAMATVLALSSTPVLAQDTTGTDSLETIETTEGGERVIIVTAPMYVPTAAQTATKSNIPLVETPQSVSVVSRDQMDLLNFIDAQQAVRYVAGASGENYGPDLRFDFIQVRGFPPKQFVDGLATPVTSTIFSNGLDLYAFESLDILKGPASVLYGSAPPGGIYNQTSRRPKSAFGGEVSMKYGTDDYKQIAMTATGAASDFADVRGTVLFRDRGAERDGVDAKRLYAAPALTLHLGPDTDLTLLSYYQYDEVNGDTNGFLPVVGTLLENPNGQLSRSANLGAPDYNKYERKQWGAGFEFEHDFAGDFGLTVNTRYSKYSEDQKVIYASGFTDETQSRVLRSSFPYAEDVKALALDTRLDGKVMTGAVEHTLLAGVDYRDVDNEAAFGFCGPVDALFFPCAQGAVSIDLFDPVYDLGDAFVDTPVLFPYTDQTLKQTGIYAQDQIAIGGLRLLFSGRYDWVKLDSFGAKGSQEEFTWRTGLSYVTEAGVVPYISYGTSFEPTLGVDLDGDPLKPTSGEQWEAGVKFDGRSLGPDVDLFATAALFDIRQKNVTSAVYSPVAAPIGSTQSGEVKVQGGELELVARIRDQLAINAAYSYTDSEIIDSEVAAEVGEPLPVTPKHKASLFADWTFQRGGLAGLGFGAGVRHVSSSAGSVPGPFNPVVYASESSTLFDAIIHYDTPNWRFAVNGSNIFDKKYVARCAAEFNCNFGAGRQVIGTATYKF
ncbi:TonB-dependent siderophore receptor [Croceicoccus sediminis]|uniref:TonB-dependent siderophore receptor n=1 Tax=Croceicoccus sediminis TaxID=2571150 RepID=UPI00118367F2|nr:TonB-dependent siderophore receptor [Croceicoccus sediminis]